MLKLCLVLFGLLFASMPLAHADQYYQCGGYAMCQCVPSGPGSGMTCDYYASGQGADMSAAAADAKSNVLATCEDQCTRKTGRQCYNIRAGNCLLIKP